MAGNIVIHILGDTTGLGKALRTAQRNVSNLHMAMQHLSTSASMALAGVAGIAAAGVGAGAVGMIAMAGGAGIAAGALMFLAQQAPAVSDAFNSMKENMKSAAAEMTAPMHGPLIGFYESLTDIFQNRLGPSITRMSEAMGPFLEKLSTSLGTVAESLGSLMETMLSSGEGAFFAFIDGLNPVMKGLEEFFVVLEDPAVTQFITDFMNSIGLLLPELAKLLAALAPVGSAILTALLPVFQELSTFIIDNVIPIMLDIANWLNENPAAIYTLVAAWVAFKAVMIGTHLILGLIRIAMVALAAMRGVVLIMTYAWAAAQWVLNASFMGFPLLWIIAAVVAVIAAVWLIVKNWDQISAWLGQAWEWIKTKFSEVWDSIINFFRNAWNTMFEWCRNAVNKIKDAVANGFSAVKNKVTEILNNVISFIMGLPGRFLQAGKDLIQGLINGVGSMAGALASKAKEVAQGALNSIKSFFGIKSPSRVMRQMGVYVGQGFVQGIDSQESDVSKAAKSMGNAVTKNFDTGSPFQRAMKRAFDEIGLTAINGIDDLEKVLLRSDISWADMNTNYGRSTLDSYIKDMNKQAGGAPTYNVTVNAGISSPEETGRTVVGAIRDYERINGRDWRQ